MRKRNPNIQKEFKIRLPKLQTCIIYMHIMQIIGRNHKGKNDNPTNGKQVVQCRTAWFLKNKSTTISNLIDFYDAVSEEIDSGNPVDIFYFDFAKAFDTVPHSKLLIKLKNLNLDEKIVKWIQDYLYDRVQRVMYNQNG